MNWPPATHLRHKCLSKITNKFSEQHLIGTISERLTAKQQNWWAHTSSSDESINQSMVTSACPSLDLHYFGEDSTISPYFLSHRSIRQSGRKHWKKIQIYEAKSYARLMMMIRWECKISSLVSTALPWAVLHCLLPLPSSFAWLHA